MAGRVKNGAIRFSGLANDTLIQAKTDELRKYASEHKLGRRHQLVEPAD